MVELYKYIIKLYCVHSMGVDVWDWCIGLGLAVQGWGWVFRVWSWVYRVGAGCTDLSSGVRGHIWMCGCTGGCMAIVWG